LNKFLQVYYRPAAVPLADLLQIASISE